MLLAVVMLFGMAAALFVYGMLDTTSLALRRDRDTAAVMADVKRALIGWSAARTPTPSNPYARPGELPCPDTDNNGFAENDDDGDGIDEANCVAGSIGRVPWKTLGIPEPKDSAGETLWYAISGNFRIYRNISPNTYTSPITSDSLGTLRVYQESTSNTITDQAVAVIFAPGAALGTQDRSTTVTMSCTAPSGTYFRNQCASNYLETHDTVNNATINGPFIQAQSSTTPSFNDRLLVITNADLMPVVEQRVAREMISYLNSYRATTGIYPWADVVNGNSNDDVASSDAYNRARFPCGTAGPYDWGRGTAPVTPSLPNWLTNGCGANGWASIIYHAIARNRLEGGGAGCGTCSGSTLTVNNTSGLTATQCSTASPPTCTPQVVISGSADLVLITPGAATTSPRGTWPTSWTAITGYFEETENSNNNNDTFVVPVSTSYDRDRIYFVR